MVTKEQIEYIRKINHTVINQDGTIKSFKEQLLEYEYGYFNARLPFVVMPESTPLLQAGAKNYPITMNPGVLVKLKDKHDLYPQDIAELPSLISEKSVLLLDSYTYPHGGLCMYLEETGLHDIPLFAAFHLDKKAAYISINEFSSIYERKNIEYTITKTWEQGLCLYPNEKTESWLVSNGLQLPADVASYLNGNYREVSRTSQIPVTDIISPEKEINNPSHEKGQVKPETLASRCASARSIKERDNDTPDYSPDREERQL